MLTFYDINDSYYYDTNRGRIEYDSSISPFDGKPVLIKTNTGIVEAWWDEGRTVPGGPWGPDEYEGWQWVCYDDQFQIEFDDVLAWASIEHVVISNPEPIQFIETASGASVLENISEDILFFDEFEE